MTSTDGAAPQHLVRVAPVPDADPILPGRVRVMVQEPVPQELDGGRQTSETRDDEHNPRKVALEDAVAGNAGWSRRPPFDPLHVRPAPAVQPPA